jgi:hypothetical protein
MVTTDTMLVGSFKDRSLSNLHVKKKIRRLSYAPFPRKGNRGYSNKNRALRNDHNTNREGKKKQNKEKLIHLQRKAISLTRIRPPLESITSRNRKRQILTSRLEKKRKRKEKKRKHVEET